MGEGDWAILDVGTGRGEASVVWQRDRVVKKQLIRFKKYVLRAEELAY